MNVFLMIVFFIGIFFTGSVKCDLVDLFIKEKQKEYEFLYLKEPKQISSLNSVIYIMLEENNYNFEDFFKKYSEQLGGKVGGIILEKSNPEYFYYLKSSSCDFYKKSKNMIVYDDRVNGRCYYFHSESIDDLYVAMKIVDNYIYDLRNSRGKYEKHKLKSYLLLLDNPVIDLLINDLSSFYDKIMSY